MISPVIRRIEEKKKTLLPRYYPGECQPAVKVGQSVTEADVVAHCEVSAGRRLIKISSVLGVPGKDAGKHLLRKVGDRIYEGEIIARKKSMFGIRKSEVKSPIDGQIMQIDERGDLMLKFMPKPVRLIAAASGVVKDISKEKITISTVATKLRGVASIGREKEGMISVVAGPKEFILPGLIKAEDKGKILVGGALLEKSALEKSVTLGVAGIVTGGMNLREFNNLGATGESLITILVTEGFGNLPMGTDMLDFLKTKDGRPALITSQEKSLIIPESTAVEVEQSATVYWKELKIGDKVRFFREESGDILGEVKELLGEQILNSGILAEVVRVRFKSGEELPLPAANLEIVE